LSGELPTSAPNAELPKKSFGDKTHRDRVR
jgi:hypothetical protein